VAIELTGLTLCGQVLSVLAAKKLTATVVDVTGDKSKKDIGEM